MDALSADEVRRLCEACQCEPTEHLRVHGYIVMGHPFTPRFLPDGCLLILAAIALAECAKRLYRLIPLADRVRVEQWSKRLHRYEWVSEKTCDHTDPLSVATAQCRAALEVLTDEGSQ